MTYLKKSGIFGLMAVSFLFRAGAAQAIPVPTIGSELAVQIDQLTKHIDELKKVKDQISNGVDQAKAMGDKMSMDALKNFAKEQGDAALSSVKTVAVPEEMSKAGLSEDVMKDPKQISNVVDNLKKSGKNGEFDMEKRRVCWEARESMKRELTMNNLANSFALQQKLASGEDMKNAQEATGASDDQMQLIGANTATLKIMYQQEASSTMMAAGDLAKDAIGSMCD